MVDNRIWLSPICISIYLLVSVLGLISPPIATAGPPEPESGTQEGFLDYKSIPAIELVGWIQPIEASACQQGRFALVIPGQVLPVAYLDGISEDLDIYLQLHVRVTGFRTYSLEQCPPFVQVMWVKILP